MALSLSPAATAPMLGTGLEKWPQGIPHEEAAGAGGGQAEGRGGLWGDEGPNSAFCLTANREKRAKAREQPPGCDGEEHRDVSVTYDLPRGTGDTGVAPSTRFTLRKGDRGGLGTARTGEGMGWGQGCGLRDAARRLPQHHVG